MGVGEGWGVGVDLQGWGIFGVGVGKYGGT